MIGVDGLTWTLITLCCIFVICMVAASKWKEPGDE